MFLRMMRVAALCAAAIATPCQAAESYDNCTGFIDTVPASISTQGNWCLRKDLRTAMTAGQAITIAANNVTLDCNHFKIGGLAGGTGTFASGVYAWNRLNTSIRNCNIRGFYRGIFLEGSGGGHLVEHNILDGNTRVSIEVAGSGSTIRGNQVLDTGGSTANPGMARGIHAIFGVDVIDNTVSGVAPTGTNAHAIGITANVNVSSTINGNRIRGLTPTGTGLAVGIEDTNSGWLIVRDNDIQGPGGSVAGGIGLYCSSNQATARNNVIAGFATGIKNCLLSSNEINPN